MEIVIEEDQFHPFMPVCRTRLKNGIIVMTQRKGDGHVMAMRKGGWCTTSIYSTGSYKVYLKELQHNLLRRIENG